MDRREAYLTLEDSWTPIGQTSNQLILYHPPSHALSVRPHPPLPLESSSDAGPSRRILPPQARRLLPSSSPSTSLPAEGELCPYCAQPLPSTLLPSTSGFSNGATPKHGGGIGEKDGDRTYFRILERAHEGSRPPSPRRREVSMTPEIGTATMNDRGVGDGDGGEGTAKGYYERYFIEDKKLGMGAEGSVYLATHVIGGNVLGTYAVKKIAVGSSKEYLVKMLREVRLLETLRHPNIIPYHHAWIDTTRFSSFGPPITALHVLMMYATAGNLDTFLLTRSHAPQPARPDLSAGDIGDADSLGQLPKAERIKAFKKRRASHANSGGANAKMAENRGVLLLGLEEIARLFGDVVEGLSFLHANSILHLDLKCSNVLLHWEEGKLIPKAMISDFGTSEEMLRGKRERTGHTGTMEYMAPETLVTDAQGLWRPSDSHADMWSLGMILHKLLFLHLPYPDTEDFDVLHDEILRYRGFIPTPELVKACERRHIPRDLLILLSKLVHVVPETRPTAEKVRVGLKALESQWTSTSRVSSLTNGLVARVARPLGDFANYARGRSEGPDDGPPRPQVEYSPVRSILALPSPTDETLPRAGVPEILPIPLEPPQIRHTSLMSAGWRLRKGNVRVVIFVIKIISLQPSISKIDFPPATVLLLIFLALVELQGGSWRYLYATTVIHLGVWINAWRNAHLPTLDLNIEDPLPIT